MLMHKEPYAGYPGFRYLFCNIFAKDGVADRESPAVTYIVDNNRIEEYSFEDIKSRIDMWVKSIANYGITHGDRVAVIAPSTPNTILIILALALSNITAVILDHNLHAEEINKYLAYSDTRGIFTTESIFKIISGEITEQIPVFDIEQSDFKPILFPTSVKSVKCTATTDKDYDAIAILFSSGTTSSMKGVMITYDSVVQSYQKQKYVCELKPGERFLHILPLNHISGYSSLITFFLSGCNIGIVENINASKLQNSLLRFNPHCFCMVPTVYDKIADKIMGEIKKKNFLVRISAISIINFCGLVRKRFGIKLGKVLLKTIYSKALGKNIRGLAVMGTMCKPDTAKLFLNFGIDWANVYGTTETSAPISSTGVFDRYVYDSVGRVDQFNDISIKINTPDENGIGEIYVKTPMIMDGYFRDAEATLMAFKDGYFKTGDLGYIDEKNYLHITGRSKETIILQNGEKVSALDVDAFYQNTCPKIKVACCGITDNAGMDSIHLFVEKADYSAEVLNKAIDALRKKSLEGNSNYRLSEIHIIDKIPETSIGKTKRYLLKEQIKDTALNNARCHTGDPISVEETVKNIVSKYVKAVADKVELQSSLTENLGLDSLALFEITNEISLQLNVEVAGMLENIKTVGELINAVESGGKITETLDMTKFPHVKTDKDLKSLKMWIWFCRKVYNFKVSGLDNIPKNENYILCSNHINNLDPVWILTAMGETDYRKIACLAAVHLYENKRTRKMFDAIGAIPVDRSGNTTPALNRCRECLNDGYSLIIFPEGARTRSGNLLPFKSGATMLSAETGIAIIPVGISGGYEIFPRSQKVPRVFNFKKMRKFSLRITFGKPIYPNGNDVQQATNMLKDEIVNLIRR